MRRVVARSYVAAAVISASTATGVFAEGSRPGSTDNPARTGVAWVLEFREHMAAKFGERVKRIGFDDPFDHSCPMGTLLTSSAGDGLGFIVPAYSLSDAASPGGRALFLRIGAGDSSVFEFSNENCRYVITVKKFAVNADGETEIGPKPVDHKRKEKEIAEGLRSGKPLARTQSDPTEPEVPPANAPARRPPLDGGFGRMGMRFSSGDPRIDIAGMLFFSRWSASLYLVNVPDDLVLESRNNPARKAYDIDVRNSGARLRFSVAKEVYVDGLWVSAFAE
jgi:hypothetical protein